MAAAFPHETNHSEDGEDGYQNPTKCFQMLRDDKENTCEDSLSLLDWYLLLFLLVQCSISIPNADCLDDDRIFESSNCRLCSRRTPNPQQSTTGHQRGCSYNMIKNRKNLSPEDAAEIDRFQRQMAAQWNSSKRDVALEFDFSPDEVAFALACYAAEGKVPENAAELIERLEDEEFQQKRSFALRGFARGAFDSKHCCDKRCDPEPRTDQCDKAAEDRAEGTVAQERDRRQLMAETNLLLRLKTCWSCRNNDADVVVVDCGHVSLCSTCSKQSNICPRCKGASTLQIKVYTA